MYFSNRNNLLPHNGFDKVLKRNEISIELPNNSGNIKQNNDEMYSYDVIVHLVADLGIDDDWQEYQEKVAQELQSKLTE